MKKVVKHVVNVEKIICNTSYEPEGKETVGGDTSRVRSQPSNCCEGIIRDYHLINSVFFRYLSRPCT